jgi:hypothetical protein
MASLGSSFVPGPKSGTRKRERFGIPLRQVKSISETSAECRKTQTLFGYKLCSPRPVRTSIREENLLG